MRCTAAHCHLKVPSVGMHLQQRYVVQPRLRHAVGGHAVESRLSRLRGALGCKPASSQRASGRQAGGRGDVGIEERGGGGGGALSLVSLLSLVLLVMVMVLSVVMLVVLVSVLLLILVVELALVVVRRLQWWLWCWWLWWCTFCRCHYLPVFLRQDIGDVLG